MGQLERYGLFFLVLVIFMILGVAIWGGGDEKPILNGKQVNAHLAGGDVEKRSAPLQQNAGQPNSELGSQDGESPSQKLSTYFGDSVGPRDATAKLSGSTELASASGGVDFSSMSEPSTDSPTSVNSPAPTQILHTIVRGDNPSTIASKYGVKTKDLMAANPGVKASKLMPGKTLRIPAATRKPLAKTSPLRSDSRAGSRTRTVVVRKNEAPSTLAKRVFGSASKANVKRILDAAGISDPTKLWAGTKLVLKID